MSENKTSESKKVSKRKKKIKPRKVSKVRAPILIFTVLALVIILAAAIIGLILWQKNNIVALKNYALYSQFEIEEKLELNEQTVQDVLQEALDNAKEVDKQNGSAAPSESTEPVATAAPTPSPESGGDTPATPAPTAKPGATPAPKPDATPAPAPSQKPGTTPAPAPKPDTTPEPSPSTKPEMGEYESQLSDVIDRIYILRAEYLGALDSLQAEATAAYKAIPYEEREKQTPGFISSYLSKGTALERSCDQRMDSLVSELRALQRKYGQSMELVESVKYTYANEKSLKKAWYMAELENKGLL